MENSSTSRTIEPNEEEMNIQHDKKTTHSISSNDHELSEKTIKRQRIEKNDTQILATRQSPPKSSEFQFFRC